MYYKLTFLFLLQAFLKVTLSLDNFETLDLDSNGALSYNEFSFFA